jgi:hypothetical protein
MRHALVALVVLMLASLACGNAPDATPAPPAAQTATARSTLEHEACRIGQNYVKTQLKAPDSAKFPSCLLYEQATETEDGAYLMKSYVDSQNSFGAMIRTTFVLEMRRNAKQWDLLSFTTYP